MSACTVVHLTGSPFVGGPERQILGLAQHLPADVRTRLLLFKDRGASQALQAEAMRRDIDCLTLEHDAPQYRKTIAEIAAVLLAFGADIVCCHGYKADWLGCRAARRIGCKTIAISHGWTGATWKVRLNEVLDRWALRRFDRVVCVSASQAEKVRRAGVKPGKIVVIRNAVEGPDAADADELAALRARFVEPKRWLIGGAGRFSPEKGYERFVAAAAIVRQTHPEAGFILFGRGPLEDKIKHAIVERGLEGHFLLGGFRTNLSRLWPGFDAAVLPSDTEGLPVMALEAMAAGVPVVATAVGGTPEAIRDNVDGFLVPPRDPAAIAERLVRFIGDESARHAMGAQARQRVLDEFAFGVQAAAFRRLFDEITNTSAVEVYAQQ